jgi:hypothetical protein
MEMKGRDEMMGSREYGALLEAAERPGGWGLFREQTTKKLAAKGYFEKAQHPSYGMQWQITEAGRAALLEEQKRIGAA